MIDSSIPVLSSRFGFVSGKRFSNQEIRLNFKHLKNPWCHLGPFRKITNPCFFKFISCNPSLLFFSRIESSLLVRKAVLFPLFACPTAQYARRYQHCGESSATPAVASEKKNYKERKKAKISATRDDRRESQTGQLNSNSALIAQI